MRSHTRRQFIAASGAGILALLASRCSIGGGGATPRLSKLGGDAWAWTRQVTGSARGAKKVEVEVGDRQMPTHVSDDRFTSQVTLAPGRNEVRASVSGGGSDSIVLDERLEARPTAEIAIQMLEGDHVALSGHGSKPTEPDGSAIASYAWSARDSNPEPLGLGSADTADLTLEAPRKDGEYYVTLEVGDGKGRTDRSTSYFVVEQGKARTVDMMHQNPAWVDNAVVYGVIPFLFGDPPLQSVTKRLPYLQKLGVNALWLSPIFRCPPGDFGYAVVDYFDINPHYGTKDDFHHLVERAHSLGIRVLMDFVPNHSSDQHPYFKDAEKHGRRSDYWTFYDRNASGQPTHYFDWSNLPNFNYSNPEMERFMLEAFSYWIRDFDVDGFRVDAAWGVKLRQPDFWPRWRTWIKRVKPDLLLLAEATARDPYYFQHGFDVAYDWTDQLGVWAWKDVFYDVPSLPATLANALTDDGRGYYRDAKVFRFLNNNDTGPRFVATYDSDTTRVAATLLLTLPGVPCVYTGDEIGASYLPYGGQTPIVWHDLYNLRPWYTKLIHLRTSTPALHSSQWDLVPIGPKNQGLFAYTRYGPGGEPQLLVVLNFARNVFDAELELPARAGALASATQLRDLLGGKPVAHGGGRSMRIKLDALEAKILEPA